MISSSSECLISRWHLTDLYFTFKLGIIFCRFVLWTKDCKLNSLPKFGERSVCLIKMKWNQWKWLTHAQLPHRALCTAHPWQTNKRESLTNRCNSTWLWFIEAKMAIIKPQFCMRFESICSFNFIFICHYFLVYTAENKVVRDKKRERVDGL